MIKKLIILNGPPRSGKDHGAMVLWRKLPSAVIMRQSAPIKAALRAMFDLTSEEVAQLELSKGATRTEDQPCPLLLGRKWPGTQISFSEAWAKPFFGEEVFGEIFARKMLKEQRDVGICADGGFVSEWKPALRLMRPADVLHIKLARPGTSFEGDSRSYYDLPSAVRSVWVHNDGELTQYEKNLVAVVEAWLSI